MLNHLDLFSGIGGWTLGFHATEEIETVGFCEIEKYPQQILKQHYPDTPIFEDVRKLDYEQLRTAGLISDTQRIDILTCSYPCQPFSVAGKKRGEEDPRHLWPEVHRLIRDDRIRPMYVLGENVGGHIRQGLDTVSEDMERCGYRWRCFSIEAACVGANHKRQRVWWIAEDVEYTNNTRDRTPKCRTNTHREKKDERRQEQSQSRVSRSSEDVADTKSEGRRKIGDSNKEKGHKKSSTTQPPRSSRDVADTVSQRGRSRTTRSKNAEDVGEPSGSAWRRNWDVEPNVGRVANGVPNRVHRLKALGNAIVPQMAYYIGTALIKDFQNKNINKIGE